MESSRRLGDSRTANAEERGRGRGGEGGEGAEGGTSILADGNRRSGPGEAPGIRWNEEGRAGCSLGKILSLVDLAREIPRATAWLSAIRV
jgi:hypothetical protein